MNGLGIPVSKKNLDKGVNSNTSLNALLKILYLEYKCDKVIIFLTIVAVLTSADQRVLVQLEVHLNYQNDQPYSP